MVSSKVKIAAQKTRKMYVKIGKELCTLEKEDIDYILNIAKTEGDICRRMTTARKRQGRVKKRKFFHASFAYEYNSSYSS